VINMRVHELAKEYKIKSTDFVDIVQSFGINIKSHLNSLDEAQIADIRFKMDMKDHSKEAELLSEEEIEELNPLGNITPEETVVTGWVKVEEELNQDQEKSEKIETEIKETLSEMKNSDSIDPLVDEGDPVPASSVVTKTGETADEWNARRTEEITKENDLIIEREQKAEEIRKHAQLHKREQIVKMERSGFWGWLRGFFG
tara:strand:- start:3137 stop:3739 length:603 start_codon:yes stop_codon:yes gene_type:complete